MREPCRHLREKCEICDVRGYKYHQSNIRAMMLGRPSTHIVTARTADAVGPTIYTADLADIIGRALFLRLPKAESDRLIVALHGIFNGEDSRCSVLWDQYIQAAEEGEAHREAAMAVWLRTEVSTHALLRCASSSPLAPPTLPRQDPANACVLRASCRPSSLTASSASRRSAAWCAALSRNTT